MLELLVTGMMVVSLAVAMITGHGESMLPAAMEGASKALSLSLRLAAGYMLFCGLMNIAKALAWPARLSSAIRPLLRWLFPGVHKRETLDAITLNFSANLLGLGNAATPAGLEAMRHLESEGGEDASVSHATMLFLVVNATSLQLFPSTVLALRAANGSVAPSAILLPTLWCTAVSTLSGVLAAKLCARCFSSRHG